MKIGLVVDPYGEKQPGGLGRAIFEMAKAILHTDTKNEYVVYLKHNSSSVPNFGSSKPQVVTLGVKYVWLTAGKKFDRTLDAYVFFTPIIPLFFTPKKSIVVVHDFAYLEQPTHSFRQKLSSRFLYFLHNTSLKKADTIIAVSEAAKQSTIKHFEIAPEKIKVIYNGIITFDAAPEKIDTPEHFFLFAGVLKPRKNVVGVIRSFALFADTHPEFHLLIAGKKSGAYFETASALAKSLGVGDKVHFLGYVQDAELAYLYTRAVAFVFPSFIEGFGMPVLEAMHLGTPVITSNTGALAEVAGGAALLAEPHNEQHIADAMRKFADHNEIRQEYIAKGKKRAEEFSWEKNGKEFSEAINSL